jgi:hypothetical protein
MISFGVGALLDFQYLADAADWLQIPRTATGDGAAMVNSRVVWTTTPTRLPCSPGTNAIKMLFSSPVGAPAIEPHGIKEWAVVLPGLRVSTCSGQLPAGMTDGLAGVDWPPAAHLHVAIDDDGKRHVVQTLPQGRRTSTSAGRAGRRAAGASHHRFGAAGLGGATGPRRCGCAGSAAIGRWARGHRSTDCRRGSVVHIGCEAASFARDVGLYRSPGYAVDEIRVFDSFPLTHHTEGVALLTRRPAGGWGLAQDEVAHP